MIITIYYDNVTKTYYLQIIRINGKIIHTGFPTEGKAIEYLINYLR